MRHGSIEEGVSQKKLNQATTTVPTAGTAIRLKSLEEKKGGPREPKEVRRYGCGKIWAG